MFPLIPIVRQAIFVCMLYLATVLNRTNIFLDQSHSQTLSDAEYVTSKLSLVDLAGSERLGKTGVSLSDTNWKSLILLSNMLSFIILRYHLVSVKYIYI